MIPKIWNIVCAALIFLGGMAGRASGAEKTVAVKTVALMPFQAEATGDETIPVTALVSEALFRRGVQVIPQEVLEGFLAKRRIRRPEFLDKAAIRAMRSILKVDAVILGSVNVLNTSENPQVWIQAQMVDCVDASVIWANSVSRTGADYGGFFGLGRIRTSAELITVVLGRLFETLPVRIDQDTLSPSPFEVMNATFSPAVLRGGDISQVSLRVREIVGKVRDVKAFVLDEEVSLRTMDGTWYYGVLAAPAINGTYPLNVYVTDRWNRLFKIGPLARLTVHNNPPEITLTPRQRLISANGDGVHDEVVFIPEILKAIALETWRVEVLNDTGMVVRSEHGIGELPEAFVWRGDDDHFRPVPDGIFFSRLVVTDKAGNTTETPKEKVIVDTTPPEVNVSIIAESVDEVVLRIGVREVNPIGLWQLVFLEGDTSEIGIFEGQGDIPETLAIKKKKTRGVRWNEKRFLSIAWT